MANKKQVTSSWSNQLLIIRVWKMNNVKCCCLYKQTCTCFVTVLHRTACTIIPAAYTAVCSILQMQSLRWMRVRLIQEQREMSVITLSSVVLHCHPLTQLHLLCLFQSHLTIGGHVPFTVTLFIIRITLFCLCSIDLPRTSESKVVSLYLWWSLILNCSVCYASVCMRKGLVEILWLRRRGLWLRLYPYKTSDWAVLLTLQRGGI